MTPIIDADAEQVRAAYIPPAVCEPIIYAVERMEKPTDIVYLERQLILGTQENREMAVLIDRKLIFNLSADDEMRRRVLEAAEEIVMDSVMGDISVYEERIILSNPRVSEMFSELMQAASDDRD